MKVSKNSKYQTHKKKKEYQTHEKPKRRNCRARCPPARAPGALKGGSFRIFQHPLLQNIKKIEGGPFGEKNFRKKMSQCRTCDFSTSILSGSNNVLFEQRFILIDEIAATVMREAFTFCFIGNSFEI